MTKGQTIRDPQAYETTWIIFDEETGEVLQRMTRQEMTIRIEEAQRLAEKENRA